MATAHKSTRAKRCRWFWCLSLHLCLLTVVRSSEDADEAYRNGRNLILEYFLPINLPAAVEPASTGREKRDVEGSGDGEPLLNDFIPEKGPEETETDNSTQNAFARLIDEGEKVETNLTDYEGSGEPEDAGEHLFQGGRLNGSEVPIIGDAEDLTTTESANAESSTKESSTEGLTTTEIGNFVDLSREETTTIEDTIRTETTTEASPETTTEATVETTTEATVETTTEATVETTTEATVETTIFSEVPIDVISEHKEPTTSVPEQNTTEEVGLVHTIIPTTGNPEEETTAPLTTFIPLDVATQAVIPDTTKETFETGRTPTSTQGLPVEAKPAPTTPEPVIEEVFKQVKIPEEGLQSSPGNILKKENLTLSPDPMLIVTNTRVMDSEENVQLSSSEPKRLGAYIVIGLILLSFSSLVGYITFRKRMNRKRQEFESHQESNDTEKALLSLSDYKDNSELEENHLKNNEITPIVVKSNSQINKFEKNTNFSSPKNLNTIANEKNIEKDNVLKRTADNLTQVIIEDSPKELDEDKNAPCMEKLIVKTRIDQDSIPKKAIIINRSSTGYLPIPQDGS